MIVKSEMKRFYYVLIVFSTILIIFLSFLSFTDNVLSVVKFQKIEKNNNTDCTRVLTTISDDVDLTINYLKLYPNVLECRLNYSTVSVDNGAQIDYTQPANESTHEYRLNRAIIFYFPIEKSENFIPEFKWLYQSWLDMQNYEPDRWRTDLIFFIDSTGDENVLNLFESYNCKFQNRRINRLDKPMCRLLNYKPLRDRLIDKGLNKFSADSLSANIYHYLYQKVNIFAENLDGLGEFYMHIKEKLSHYSYIDSILIAFDGYEDLKENYDLIMRSDMDVFLTPLYAKWLPYNCNDFYVGGGGYSDTFNMKRLNRISSNLKLNYANVGNLGSTWYSTPEQIRLVSYLTIVSMLYLSNEEFSPPEKSFKEPLLWPYWHYGVLLLYGQNLAMNHLIATKQLNIIKLNDMIDVPTDSETSIYKAIHLHVFHGNSLFSKFSFKSGEYDYLRDYNRNIELGNFYALNIALKSKLLNSSSVLARQTEINAQKCQEMNC